MGLKSWWKEFRFEGIQLEVDDLCKEYICEKNIIQPYPQLKKQAERECFPKKGDDILAKKQAFIDACSSREREFQERYMAEGNNSLHPLKSQISRDNEQDARLVAHYKWQELLFYSGFGSKSQGRSRS